MASFSDLGIDPAIVQVLERQGIIEPFEVQTETIPDSLLGKDVCCRAPTGSGKTLAFGLPLITRSKRAHSKRPTSLILTPTRELAEQINSVLRPIAAAVDRDHAAMYSAIEAHGAGISDAQKAELKGRLELIEFADNISHS